MKTTILRTSMRGLNDKSLSLSKPRHARKKDRAAKASRGIDTMLANKSSRVSYESNRPHENEVDRLVRMLLADSDQYADTSELVSHAKELSKKWGWIS